MLKKELYAGLNIFFANKIPKITIEVPIAKLNHIYIPETSWTFNFKNSDMPLPKKVTPNTKCTADKIHALI